MNGCAKQAYVVHGEMNVVEPADGWSPPLAARIKAVAPLAPLLAQGSWAIWRYENRNGGKPSKVPYVAADPTRKASSRNSSDWCDFDSATAAAKRQGFDGVSFALTNSRFAAFDLDDCRNPATGELAQWATVLLEEAKSYAEITPSGTGLRIIGYGREGPPVHNKLKAPAGGCCEIYRKAVKFIAVTGDALDGWNRDIVSIDVAIDNHRRTTSKAPVDEDGAERASDYSGRTADLPGILEIVRRTDSPDRSKDFFKVVKALQKRGWAAGEIEALFADNPDGVASKYWNRLRQEVDRAFRKTADHPREKFFKEDAPFPGAPAPAGGRFEVVPFEAITLDTRSAYLVRGIMPRTGLVIIWGPPKCGKSFWIFDLMMHVSLGWDYRGHRVKQGAVVYCAPEGAHGFKARIEAFRQRHLAEQPEAVPFYLVPCKMALVRDKDALIAAIRAKLGNVEPAAIVIDTLNRSIAGSESDDRDMGAYLDAAELVQEAFKCVVPIVHHCGHDTTRPRGHSSITGTVEAQIAVRRHDVGNILTIVEEMKDGPDGTQITSRLEPVDVGTDEDGEPISSCVIVAVEGAAKFAKHSAAPKPLRGANKLVYDALHEALGACGEFPPASNEIPPNVRCVTLDQWQNYAEKRGLCANGKPDSKRVAFGRASTELKALRKVGIWDKYVWSVQEKQP